jgi:FtsP/CotA-like multicopper oxidase with cupredoxin domain
MPITRSKLVLMKSGALAGAALAAMAACCVLPVAAQTPDPCPPQVILQPLEQPPELTASGGELSTTFTVRMENHPCVPFFDGTDWTWKAMDLRTYVFPPSPGADPVPSTPGPTLRVRRAAGGTPGDALSILLVNDLPVPTTPSGQCNSACPEGDDTCCPPAGEPCPPSCTKGCAQESYPECFHGDDITNLHFHGTHVSPQAPQDYVLLELAPSGTPPEMAGHTHSRGLATTGQYQYAINPFPSNQAEGTHWYHPHKHGSVSVQVLNGMAGALIIEGPFDDWLNGFYDDELTEQVLVIQQLDSDLNFFRKDPSYAPPQPLVNGQANPVVTMRPGEIQRWRFVDATMQGSAQIAIGFESTDAPVLKQIAQDGVQFAPANYGSQPLLTQGELQLSPGNRADFLVQAPATPGTHLLTFEVFGLLEQEIKGRHEAHRRGLLQHLTQLAANADRKTLTASAGQGLAAAAAAASDPPLLTVNVVGDPVSMAFPSQDEWPQPPSFLRDVADDEVTGERTVLFSMQGTPGVQPDAFFINNKQFDPSCVDETMQIGTAEQWTVANSSNPQHPFHIHTNPFQIIASNGQSLPQPWIWWDTFALPAVSATAQDFDAGPIFSNQEAQTRCPTTCEDALATWNGQWTTTEPNVMSVCGCLPWGSITTRSRFEDYTGEYVIHCHFLGHEDRGMMVAVQTTCQGTPTPVWGQTQASGTADDCQTTTPASPACQ